MSPNSKGGELGGNDEPEARRRIGEIREVAVDCSWRREGERWRFDPRGVVCEDEDYAENNYYMLNLCIN